MKLFSLGKFANFLIKRLMRFLKNKEKYMNKNIKLAVAGAVLALSASAANAGIVIPAGDWTLDINGNVNAYMNFTKLKGDSGNIYGALAGTRASYQDNVVGINTGLLPAWLGFTGTTRQNDTDVSFTISMQPNVSDNAPSGDVKAPLFRQAFLTFGDKSWGTIKLGKDIGIFAQNAILNDMTLLGVGAGAASSGASTTLGGIGSGYIYAAWKGQATYTTPNFNGFQASVGLFNPNQTSSAHGSGLLIDGGASGAGGDTSAAGTALQDRFGLEGSAHYAFTGDALTGKVWVSGASYDVTYNGTGNSFRAQAADLGATVSAGNVGLTAYYYTGEGVGTTIFGRQGADSNGKRRESDGGYLQATYVLPTKTKVGLAYGRSTLDRNANDAIAANALVKENERVTLGLYHPLTKHLNLVAEYNDISSSNHVNAERTAKTGSLGAILFF
jgi:hypothetical protein